MMNILFWCNCSPKNALIDLQCCRSELEPIFNASQQGNCTRSDVSANTGKGAHLVHKCNWDYLRLEILISLIFRGFSAYVSFCRLYPLLGLGRRPKLIVIANEVLFVEGRRFLQAIYWLVGAEQTGLLLRGVVDRGVSLPGYQNSYKFHFEVTYRRFPFYPLRATTWGLFGVICVLGTVL